MLIRSWRAGGGAALRRITVAGFLRPKRIEELDCTASPSTSPAVIHQLALYVPDRR